MPLSEEAIATLRRVQAAIRREPNKLGMDFWFRHPDHKWIERAPGVIEVIDGTHVPPTPLAGLLQECGTAACIAGHYVAQMGERAVPGLGIEETASDDLARGDLGIAPRALFFTSHWPPTLREMFEGEASWDDEMDGIELDADDLPSPEVRAEAACRAIDEWIKADGDDQRFLNAAVRI